MIYFFHHYELPVIVQQAQLQQMFMRRNNNNGQAEGQQPSNQQMNRENQQQPANEAEESNAGVEAAAAPVEEAVNNNNMFVIRGAYRRRVNQMVERLRNNFYNNVFGVGIISDTNNNNALRNQAGFNNLTRSLRLLNTIFPNRPILNVRIINVRSASTAATAGDIMRNVQPSNQENSTTNEASQTLSTDENVQQGREHEASASSSSISTTVNPNEKHANVTQAEERSSENDDNNDILGGSSQTTTTTVINSSNDELQC